MSSHPRLIFGASTVGDHYTTVEAVNDLLALLKAHDIADIDTAGLYPFTNIGRSESLLGKADAVQQGFKVDTKILVTSKEGNGTLEPAKIEQSIQTSNERLKCGASHKLNIVHCHVPDYTTPLEDQAATLNALHKKGQFQQLGVCNFPLDMLTKFIDICTQNNYIKPTIYQGNYNLISRSHEAIFPTLRKHNIIFNAHSPLATGFLSGKFTSGDFAQTRFSGTNVSATALKAKYDNEAFHAAIRSLNDILAPTGMSSIEAALRWISYHSQLGPQDGIILGATKPRYITENVALIKKGPLSQDIVTAIDRVWSAISSGNA